MAKKRKSVLFTPRPQIASFYACDPKCPYLVFDKKGLPKDCVADFDCICHDEFGRPSLFEFIES